MSPFFSLLLANRGLSLLINGETLGCNWLRVAEMRKENSSFVCGGKIEEMEMLLAGMLLLNVNFCYNNFHLARLMVFIMVDKFED